MKVVLFCGGLGMRMREYSEVVPKPMVPIGYRPILWHIMRTYASFGFTDFAIALGYKGEIIKDFFLNYKLHKSDMIINLKSGDTKFENDESENWNVSLHETGVNSLTGGRLLNLKKIFKPGETFMLTYGDGVSDVDIEKLVKFHKAHGKIATLTAVRPPARFGSIEMENDGHILEFKEKPQLGEGWINGGYFVFDYKIFDYLKDEQTILEREPLETLAKQNQLVAYRHEGFWHCMDTIRDRDNLNEIWAKGNAPWKK